MSNRMSYFCSTIGRKQLIGLTGIGLSLFVLTHMLGNLLIFVGPEAYNKYSHALVSNPAIYLAEAGLLLIFVLHLLLASFINLKNRLSRPQKYAVASSGAKKTTWIQKTLWHQGVVILVFLVLHLITFKFGTEYLVAYDGKEIRDIFILVRMAFEDPKYVIWYVFSLIVLGFHLHHGLASSIKTLGFNHPKYEPKVNCVAKLYAWTVSVGFITQPLYFYFLYKG